MLFYPNSITNAVYTIANSWEWSLLNNTTHVEIDKYMPLNTDINRDPWIGVYPPTYTLEPNRAQIYRPFKGTFTIPVILQVTNLRNVEQAITTLEQLTDQMITAVNCDRELMNTVDSVIGIQSSPYTRVIETETNQLMNELLIIAEVQ